MAKPQTLQFSIEEQTAIEVARVLVSGGDFEMSRAEFVRHATMQVVDEILGVNNEAARMRLVRERNATIRLNRFTSGRRVSRQPVRSTEGGTV